MYRVTIEEITEVTKPQRSWERLVTTELARERGTEEFGYAPPIERTEVVRRDIYEQTVEELDLARVIVAINPACAAYTIVEPEGGAS